MKKINLSKVEVQECKSLRDFLADWRDNLEDARKDLKCFSLLEDYHFLGNIIGEIKFVLKNPCYLKDKKVR